MRYLPTSLDGTRIIPPQSFKSAYDEVLEFMTSATSVLDYRKYHDVLTAVKVVWPQLKDVDAQCRLAVGIYFELGKQKGFEITDQNFRRSYDPGSVAQTSVTRDGRIRRAPAA
jgi:hypothetical protein